MHFLFLLQYLEILSRNDFFIHQKLYYSQVLFGFIGMKKKKKKRHKIKRQGEGGGVFFQRQYQTKPNQIKPKPVQRLRERTSEQVTLDLNMTSPYISFWVTFESFEQDQGSNFLD